MNLTKSPIITLHDNNTFPTGIAEESRDTKIAKTKGHREEPALVACCLAHSRHSVNAGTAKWKVERPNMSKFRSGKCHIHTVTGKKEKPS
jgi:hypothetical protein